MGNRPTEDVALRLIDLLVGDDCGGIIGKLILWLARFPVTKNADGLLSNAARKTLFVAKA
jgi:hypothetical protein